MSRHLQIEIEHLKKRILAIAGLTEEQVFSAVRSLESRDRDMALKVIENDSRVDQMEVEIEEECLKVLALHQPVATDLRFIIAVLKINNDLERIADLAVNIAERSAYLATQPAIEIPFDLNEMGGKASSMLKKALDALVNMDSAEARMVCAQDDEVDALNRDAFSQVEAGIRRNPDHLERLIHQLSVARHLERVADLATNIAEDVIYMVRGEIVRHRHENYNEPPASRN